MVTMAATIFGAIIIVFGEILAILIDYLYIQPVHEYLYIQPVHEYLYIQPMHEYCGL